MSRIFLALFILAIRLTWLVSSLVWFGGFLMHLLVVFSCLAV